MTFREIIDGAAAYLLAKADVDRVLEMSPAVARRDLKTQNREERHLRMMIRILDEIARGGQDQRSERAAELAEYMETLL